MEVTKETDIPQIKGVLILDAIGSGNFGSVFKGQWNGASVALKKLKRDEYQVFKKEAAILKSLIHPNILQVGNLL